MCAITGLISQSHANQFAAYAQTVLSIMRHRGPDATKIEFLEGYGGFGHNRLSIIDLSEKAIQPMWDSTRRFCLIFNGEIYNYLDIQSELKARGHCFQTRSDAEVLVEAWSFWGIAVLSKLVGMFAFAIWDQRDKKLFLVRDRMGEKPLFYAPIANDWRKGVVFASELKGLLKYPFFTKEISFTALNHFLSYGYTSTSDCIFKNIHKLSPAHSLTFDVNSGRVEKKEYWQLANYFRQKNTISYAAAQTELQVLLENSVKQQSIADVPLGAFLSGGVDSSIIVANLCEQNKPQLNTYSLGFKQSSYDESAKGEAVAKFLSINHATKMLSEKFHESLSKIFITYDEPFADSSLIPTYFLSQFARQQVKVCLSGDGGDELFGGYSTYQADRYHQLMRYLPLSIKKILLKTSHFCPTSFNKISFDYKAKQFLQGCLLDKNAAHLSWREMFNPWQKQNLLKPDLAKLHHPSIASPCWFQDIADCHMLDQAMYVDLKTWLVDDILVKVDRASMTHSLEVRAPFLDHRLVEFAASLPIRYKIRGRNGKRILKASYKNKLPSYILHQAKKGFNSPIAYWLNDTLFELAYDLTTSNTLLCWFNKSYIEKLWQEHKSGRYDHGHRLFNLLSLGFWCQYYL